MFDKAKMLAQAFKIKKAMESLIVKLEENGIEIEIAGDQKFKKLVINGVENRMLVDMLNKAIKKSQEEAAKKMKEMGGLEGLL